MNGNDRDFQTDFQDTGTGGRDERGTMRAAPVAAAWERPRRSPPLATLLSMMPGLGQIYVGYYQQGFLNMAVVATCITILASNQLHSLKPFFGLGLAFFWLFNMIDANRRAHHFNRAMAGMDAEKLPEDFKLPKAGGSLFGGILMIAVGLLVILDLNFDVSLEWIEDWWPLVLVLIGARLVWNSRRRAG